MSQAPSSGVDSATADRLRDEWSKVKSAVQGLQAGVMVSDPLGHDGEVQLASSMFRHTGAGEVVFLKGAAPGDRRYTRFRTWGPTGVEYIEKSSYLVKENGVTEFHKRRAEPGDNVVAVHEQDGDDQGWTQGLA